MPSARIYIIMESGYLASHIDHRSGKRRASKVKTLKGKRMRILLQSLAFVVLASGFTTGQLIVDHHCTRLTKVPKSAITLAKSKLHIVYGHTSHGSQLTTGMTGLVTFTKGCGGPEFAWNDGGTGGALDFHDGGMAGDVGSYPQWVDETKKYLNNPSNSNVNVVIWSWCGQHSWYSEKQMNEWYLAPMTQLEKDYPKVTFVYMTGHVFNGYNREPMMARNKQIREYCVANKKVLYDFADIESYDPDGKFFTYVDDNCDYYDKEIGGTKLGNWAIEWQNAHTQGVDWYTCNSAHSQPLNANLKAYAAWWLWARIAGWPGIKTLTRDKDEVSTTTGGTVRFSLDAGQTRAGGNYLQTGSFSGTSPGFVLPGNHATLPLNLDVFSYHIIGLINHPPYQNFLGTLNNQGQAAATLNLGPLPPQIAGLSMHFAYALYDYPMDFTSNAMAVRFVP